MKKGNTDTVSVAERILELPPTVALGLVFLLPMLESSAFFGFLAPGEIAVIMGGVLANQGKLSLAAVIVLSILGAVIGDFIGYEVGKRYGQRLLRRIPHWIVSQHHLEKATAFIRKHGGKAVFFGRFTTTLRVMVPGIAGMSRLERKRFLTYNILGGAIWAPAYSVLGYLLGTQYHLLEKYSWLAVAVVVGLVFIAGTVHFAANRRSAA